MSRKSESPGVKFRGKDYTTFSDPSDIGRTQLILFRRRLGTLTREQELQIENLLISTITRVSLCVGKVMAALSENFKRSERS